MAAINRVLAQLAPDSPTKKHIAAAAAIYHNLQVAEETQAKAAKEYQHARAILLAIFDLRREHHDALLRILSQQSTPGSEDKLPAIEALSNNLNANHQELVQLYTDLELHQHLLLQEWQDAKEEQIQFLTTKLHARVDELQKLAEEFKDSHPEKSAEYTKSAEGGVYALDIFESHASVLRAQKEKGVTIERVLESRAKEQLADMSSLTKHRHVVLMTEIVAIKAINIFEKYEVFDSASLNGIKQDFSTQTSRFKALKKSEFLIRDKIRDASINLESNIQQAKNFMEIPDRVIGYQNNTII